MQKQNGLSSIHGMQSSQREQDSWTRFSDRTKMSSKTSLGEADRGEAVLRNTEITRPMKAGSHQEGFIKVACSAGIF